MSQTVAADRIILWIAHDDRAALDEQLLGLVDAGLEIRFCEDLLSYKKIIPTLREMPGAVIVTADDDVYYWPTWLEELVRAHTEDRRTVMCHRANSVRLGESGQPAPYLDWSLDTRSNGTSSLVFPTGVGGVLYPPGVFYSDVLREDLFRELCPSGDDIWLYWMVRLNRGRSRKIGKRRVFTEWPGFRVGGLAQYNYLQGGNDRQIQAMVGAYGFPHV
ncbi:MAG: glycosyltransferase family 2 protein [Proteobacteria bacterium]|nr:glycosyltransferase family 2 protein [Pseudomonadota bacterium]